MNVLVVFCHALGERSFTGAVLDRCVAGLRDGGHTHRVVDVEAGDEPGDVVGVDSVVFVYPTWWSGQPARLTDWLQRAVTTTSFREVRRIVAITSHGSPKLTNIVEGEAGKNVLFRAFRAHAHPRATTRWVGLYRIDTCSDEDRATFLDRVEQTMRRPGL